MMWLNRMKALGVSFFARLFHGCMQTCYRNLRLMREISPSSWRWRQPRWRRQTATCCVRSTTACSLASASRAPPSAAITTTGDPSDRVRYTPPSAAMTTTGDPLHAAFCSHDYDRWPATRRLLQSWRRPVTRYTPPSAAMTMTGDPLHAAFCSHDYDRWPATCRLLQPWLRPVTRYTPPSAAMTTTGDPSARARYII